MLKPFIDAGLNALKYFATPKSAIAIDNEKKFASAVLRPAKIAEIDLILKKFLPATGSYKAVAEIVNKGMPWWVVLLEHAMEAGAMKNPFMYHLHCGDPLTARTVHVPKGRPKHNPKFGTEGPSKSNPYSWAESAIDALMLVDYDKEHDWSLGNILWEFEKFNGTGYRKYHPDVPTPYVWSYTTIYSKGKYVLDGKYDKNAVSKQPGCAAYLLRLIQTGVVKL